MASAHVVPYEGEAALLRALCDSGLTLRLFGNDADLTRQLTAADLTEVTFPGYAPIPLAAALWEVTAGDGKRVTRAEAPFQRFLRTEAGEREVVRGWYLTTRAGRVAAAERFPLASGEEPWEMARQRDAVEVWPVLVMAGV